MTFDEKKVLPAGVFGLLPVGTKKQNDRGEKEIWQHCHKERKKKPEKDGDFSWRMKKNT
ncbi:MAG: hypothetical protein J5819_02670 [Eubacterium sp.]|nr:hypothetical protein [Eubacterium sp.]